MESTTATPNAKNPRIRGRRLSRAQFDHLIKYMTENKAFANPLSANRIYEKDTLRKMWAELSNKLNCLGPSKTVQQWHKVWVDIKYKTTQKFNKLRLLNSNSDDSAILQELSDADKKVLAIFQVDLDNPSSWEPISDEKVHVQINGKIIPLEQLQECPEVVITEGTCEGMDSVEMFCQEAENENSDCLSNDREPTSSLMIHSVESMQGTSSNGRKRVAETVDVDDLGPSQKKVYTFERKPFRYSKSQDEVIHGLLNSQQETMHLLLNSHQEMMQNLLSSQQKLMQSVQSSQQEMTKSLVDLLNRRADLEEKAILLEEEKLKVIERKVLDLEERLDITDYLSN